MFNENNDITLCNNPLCPKSQLCFRSNAIPNQFWQSYAMFNFNHLTNSCDEYIPIADLNDERLSCSTK